MRSNSKKISQNAPKRANAQINKNKMTQEKALAHWKDVLSYIGENPQREGLKETPKRIVKSWEKLFSGYKKDPSSVLKTFTEGSCKEMVILKDIEFYSVCEHHFLPFFGTISIGYLPNKKVIGISKLARLVEIFSRRLQIQENLVAQIAGLSHLRVRGLMTVAPFVEDPEANRSVFRALRQLSVSLITCTNLVR